MPKELRIILVAAAFVAMALALFMGLLPEWTMPVRGKRAVPFFCLLMLLAAVAAVLLGWPSGREMR